MTDYSMIHTDWRRCNCASCEAHRINLAAEEYEVVRTKKNGKHVYEKWSLVLPWESDEPDVCA